MHEYLLKTNHPQVVTWPILVLVLYAFCLFVCCYLFRQKNALHKIVKGDEEDGNGETKDENVVFLTTEKFVFFHNLFTDKISALFGGQRNSNLHSVLVKDDFTKRQHRLLLVLND